MFDVGDLPLLTFGNCVLKTGVIKRPLKLCVRFLRFFSKSKKRVIFLTFFELLQTFSRTMTLGARNSTTPTEAPTLHQFKSAT